MTGARRVPVRNMASVRSPERLVKYPDGSNLRDCFAARFALLENPPLVLAPVALEQWSLVLAKPLEAPDRDRELQHRSMLRVRMGAQIRCGKDNHIGISAMHR